MKNWHSRLRSPPFGGVSRARAAAADARGNLEKLSEFKTTGTPMDIPQIPQTGAKADAIKKNARPHQAAARLQDRPLRDRAGRAPHGGRAAGRRDLRRHPQEQGLGGDRPRQGPRRRRGQGVRAVDRLRDPERRVLLARRLPVHRRAEPGAGVSGRRVLLRGPGRRGLRGGQAGRADPAGGGILQSHRAHLPHRAGRQALHHARPAVQRVRAGEDGPLQAHRHRRHRPHEPRGQGPRSVRHRRAQLGRHGLQSEGQVAVVHRQPGGRNGRRHPAGRAQPRRQAGHELRLPVVRRRQDAHQRVQGPAAAGRRDASRRSRWRRTRPTSA